MTVHPVTTADIPRIIDLLKQVGGVHHDLRPDLFRAGAQKYDEAALRQLLSDPARPIFGAYREERLVGYCFCVRQEVRDDPVLRDRKSLYIDDLCVDESCRRQGIARALYDYTLDYAKKEGFDAVTLNVWAGNPAESFYRQMGMQTQKTVMEQLL